MFPAPLPSDVARKLLLAIGTVVIAAYKPMIKNETVCYDTSRMQSSMIVNGVSMHVLE